jgi:hypothetical protein
MVSLVDGKILRDHGNIHSGNVYEYHMIFGTKDGKSLLAISENGGFRERSVRGMGVVQDFGKAFGDIRAMSD